MARRRQVNRHEIRVGPSVRVEVDRRFEAGPFCLHGRIGIQQVIKFQARPPGDRTPTFHTHKTGNLVMDLMVREKSPDIERNGKSGGESIENQTPRRNVTGTWGGPVVVILQRRNLRFRVGRHEAIRRIQRLGDVVVESKGPCLRASPRDAMPVQLRTPPMHSRQTRENRGGFGGAKPPALLRQCRRVVL